MSEVERSYGQELMEVMRKLHNMKRKKKGFGDLTHMDIMVLFHIDCSLKSNKDDTLGIKVSQITKIMDIPKPATSKTLNSLEEKGYISRSIDSSDRRVVYVNLTDEGKKTIVILSKKRDHYINNLMVKLGHDDAENLIRIIDKLYNIVMQEQEEIK